jgi:predicted transposase/invertase (TIGR01784 family)
MRFISPKTDFAFKKIFGSTASKPILISFLNAIIYQGEKIIQDLEIIDPYNPPETPEFKGSYLDVKATLNNGTIVIIEMQVLNVPAFEKRVVYNLAKTYSNQLKYGQGYIYLQPVIALTITDFTLFTETEEVITFWVFKEQRELIDYSNEELKMVFIELPKFEKNLEELETLTEKWIYFIKEAPNLEVIPEKMGEVEEINQALTIANLANLSEKELDELHHQEVFLQDQRGYVIKAREEGRVSGQIELIQRLLEQKFGELPIQIKESLANLRREKLEELSRIMLDFNRLQDLINFLENN